MRLRATLGYVFLLVFFPFFSGHGQDAATFANPLLPSGADPWTVYHDGYYYYTHSLQDSITLWKTRNLADLGHAERKTVWKPPVAGPHSHQLWAPELHHLRGKWYLYYAASDGNNRHHRLWVLENSSPDPLEGPWILKGKVSDASDKWAIDGTVFENGGQLYLAWSGWEGDVNGRQDIYLAKLKNPWTIEGKRVRLSSPTYAWERNGDTNGQRHVAVNEGPQLLRRDGRVFLFYSASGCWTDTYALGRLTAPADGNLLDANCWEKSPEPVFQQSPADGVFAPGHNAFFRSPDGTEDWILYHANDQPGQGCGSFRTPRAQRFTWRVDGTPDFGRPVGVGVPLRLPSGNGAKLASEYLSTTGK
ncbi:MAG: glycoside hydrolase family 43 protein [Ferruginibacter sp.]|nr:glycoside hydrolase family 43 protein [Cytophagales bacterium]